MTDPHDSFRAIGEWFEAIFSATLFAAVGFAIAIGKILQSEERPTWPVAVGRCLVTGGLAVAAGLVLTVFPDLSKAGQLGVAAALASLGTTGLELLVKRVLGGERA